MADDQRFYEEIGRRIRLARVAEQLTQVELGSAVQLSRTSITNIESGNQQPSIRTLIRICEVLEKEPSDLLNKLPLDDETFISSFPDDVPKATREALTNLSKNSLSEAGR